MIFLNVAICQLRLDFDDFRISQPTTTTGDCDSDTFAVTSPSGRGVPSTCGKLTGTHSKLSQ